jgi:uncharacterized protein YhaN
MEELMQRIAALEEQVRVLSREKRGLEEKVEKLTRRCVYVSDERAWYWKEVQNERG